MSEEPLTNAAAEAMAAGNATLRRASTDRSRRREIVENAARGLLAGEMVYEDRRSGGFNFGVLDRAQYIELLLAGLDVATNPATFDHSVLAIRGERCAALRTSTSYGSETVETSIQVVRIDRERLIDRIVGLDIADTEAADGLLDEWHAEIDEEQRLEIADDSG